MITPETFNGGAMALTGTGDYYMGPGHKRFITVTLTQARNIYLPDASQPPMGSGGPVFFVWNTHATLSITFKDISGDTIAVLAPTKKARIYLGHTATANGHWLIHGATKDAGYEGDSANSAGKWGNGDSGDATGGRGGDGTLVLPSVGGG